MGLQTVRFAGSLQGGESETLEHDVTQRGEVVGVDVRIYRGPEHSLEVTPEVVTGGEGAAVSLIQLEGKESITGDGDAFELKAEQEVTPNDVLQVFAQNTSDKYDDDGVGWEYDYAVDIHVDHGFQLFDGLRGVF